MLEAMADPSGGSGKPRVVYVVDDDARKREVMALLEPTCDVVPAYDSAEALAALRTAAAQVVCVELSAQTAALELLRLARQLYAGLSTILIADHRDLLADGASTEVAHVVLLRPYAPRELVTSVERAITRARLQGTLARRASGTMSAVAPPSSRRDD